MSFYYIQKVKQADWSIFFNYSESSFSLTLSLL